MSLTDGIYRIYHGSTNFALTLSRPTANAGLQYVVGQYDDQDPAANAYQQWSVKYWAQSKTYTLFNVGGGLFFTLTMDANGLHYSRGSKMPYQLTLVPESGSDTFSIKLKPMIYSVRFETASVGTKTIVTEVPVGATRNWIFRRATSHATPKPQPPLVTVPLIKPGVYRLLNTAGRTYLSQQRDITGNNKYPLVVGRRFQSEDNYQYWSVVLHEQSQTYFLKNQGSGRWLSTVDNSRRDGNPNEFAAIPAADGPVHWEIRNQERELTFSIVAIATGPACVMALDGGSSNDNTAVRLQTRRDVSSTYDSWRFEAVNLNISAVTNSPVPFTGALKTGKFYIRNRVSRTLLTQLQVNETAQAQIVDPRVVASRFEVDSTFQQWSLIYYKDQQQYAIKNVGSGRYVSPSYGSSDTFLIATDLLKTWDIRRGEDDEEYLLHVPGWQQVITLTSGSADNGAPVRINQRATQFAALFQRWIFEPVDPLGKDLKNPDDSDPGPNPGPNPGPDDWTEQQAKDYLKDKPASPLISDGVEVKSITNVLTGTAITIRTQNLGSPTPITGEQVTTAHNDPQQTWEFKESGDYPGQYYLFNSSSGQTFAWTDPAKDGAYVTATDEPDTRWEVKSDGKGSTLFVVPGTGLALYLESNTPGSGIYLKYARDEDGFKWQPYLGS